MSRWLASSIIPGLLRPFGFGPVRHAGGCSVRTVDDASVLLFAVVVWRLGVNVSVSGLDGFSSVWPADGFTAVSSLHGATILGLGSRRSVTCFDGSAILRFDASNAITLVGIRIGLDRQRAHGAKHQNSGCDL